MLYVLLLAVIEPALSWTWWEPNYYYQPLWADQSLSQRAKRYRGPMMGQQNECDDARTKLETDWPDFDYHYFTCPTAQKWRPDPEVPPTFFSLSQLNHNFDPRRDLVYHKCMNTTIEYEEDIPVRGDHRPNWAVFGEYLYLPVQRWLHNLEHGSVVMLYHPCADEGQVNRLKEIVRSCLYRHVITPSNKVSKERPLVLVTWGTKYEMNIVDPDAVREYIKNNARRSPEDLSKQGVYVKGLVAPSRVVTTISDDVVCPMDPRQKEPVYSLNPAEFF